MIPPRPSRLSTLERYVTAGFHGSVICACLAFTVMLLLPGNEAESLLSLAWLCMLASAACLAVRLVVGAAQDRAAGPSVYFGRPHRRH